MREREMWGGGRGRERGKGVEKNILNDYNLNLKPAVTFLIFVSDTKILLFWNRRSLMNANKN